jgi:hypothetical protein
MNFDRFCSILNVLFFHPTTDIATKVGFINTCDASSLARDGGKSFGLTLGEFFVKNKRILTAFFLASGDVMMLTLTRLQQL